MLFWFPPAKVLIGQCRRMPPEEGISPVRSPVWGYNSPHFVVHCQVGDEPSSEKLWWVCYLWMTISCSWPPAVFFQLPNTPDHPPTDTRWQHKQWKRWIILDLTRSGLKMLKSQEWNTLMMLLSRWPRWVTWRTQSIGAPEPGANWHQGCNLRLWLAVSSFNPFQPM